MRRRLLLGSLWLLVPAVAVPAITRPPAASRFVRHHLGWPQLLALEGQRLGNVKAAGSLSADFKRLLGRRYERFMAGLADELPMHRIGDAIVGEGTRPGTLGHEASLFVLGRDGAMFAVTKSGEFGADIEEFGSSELVGDWNVRHRYLEFEDLDE